MLGAYNQFSAYLRKVSGIVITEEKNYLVESRILPIIQREKMSGMVQLLSVLESGKAPSLVQEVIEVMTINETYFFRDKTPFDLISDKLLPALHSVRPGSDTIKIWSAACSTGQEPYSLSMLIDEQQMKLRGRRIEISATDVSEAVLAKASEGSYTLFEAERGLTPERRQRHFTVTPGGLKVKPHLKERITYRKLNLLADYSSMGSFDIVLCRNVLIYFDTPQKSDILRRLEMTLRPDGYLLLGASESILGTGVNLVADPDFKGCFRKAGRTVADSAPLKRIAGAAPSTLPPLSKTR